MYQDMKASQLLKELNLRQRANLNYFQKPNDHFAFSHHLDQELTLLSSHEIENKLIEFGVINDDDDRVDYYDISEVKGKILENAMSVVAIVEKSKINLKTSDFKDPKTLNERLKSSPRYGYPLCPKERFGGQISTSVCSGFVVRENQVITAGHCVSGSPTDKFYYKDLVVIRGFKNEKRDQKSYELEIFEVVGFKKSFDQSLDWGILELKDPVPNFQSPEVRSQGRISNNQNIYILGHPTGLPLKLADNAVVKWQRNDTFLTDLDAFQGNSGSPVFNSGDHKVEGILVSGKQDFAVRMQQNGKCLQSIVCRRAQCGKEKVLRITEVPF